MEEGKKKKKKLLIRFFHLYSVLKQELHESHGVIQDLL